MATNTVSGPRKRKLSTKATTNVKRKKSATNKGETVAPTQKKVTGTGRTAVPSKPGNRASEKVPGKAQKATVEDVEDLEDSNDDLTLEDQAAEIISIDDDEKTEDETNQEAAKESAEAELGRKHIFCI